MKRTKLAASFLLVATLFLTGCVTKKEFVNLQTDYNKLKDEKLSTSHIRTHKSSLPNTAHNLKAWRIV